MRSKLAAVCFASLIAIPSSTEAVQFPNGTVSFSQSPRLVNATTTFDNVNVPAAKYYFTIALPADVDEPLSTVSIQQRSGADDVRFLVDRTFAFIGTPNSDRESVNVQAASVDGEEARTISISFDPPISPGSTITVGLRPRRNPRIPGTYLFGVTAFPQGEKPLGLYLGPGRLQFRSNDRDFD